MNGRIQRTLNLYNKDESTYWSQSPGFFYVFDLYILKYKASQQTFRKKKRSLNSKLLNFFCTGVHIRE